MERNIIVLYDKVNTILVFVAGGFRAKPLATV